MSTHKDQYVSNSAFTNLHRNPISTEIDIDTIVEHFQNGCINYQTQSKWNPETRQWEPVYYEGLDFKKSDFVLIKEDEENSETSTTDSSVADSSDNG